VLLVLVLVLLVLVLVLVVLLVVLLLLLVVRACVVHLEAEAALRARDVACVLQLLRYEAVDA
jgi:hypothetical protein